MPAGAYPAARGRRQEYSLKGAGRETAGCGHSFTFVMLRLPGNTVFLW